MIPTHPAQELPVLAGPKPSWMPDSFGTHRPAVRRVLILGSTGSIGTQAIDVIQRNPGRFTVVGLAASGTQVDLLAEQAVRLGVGHIAVADRAAASRIRQALASRLPPGHPLPDVMAGPTAAAELSAHADYDTVLNGMSGSVGLAPTLAALKAGKTVALANKESLVAGAPLIRALARPGQIIPVDSEHSGLFQALAAGPRAQVRRLLITASGGPFLGWTHQQLQTVTPRQALAHPTWNMGPLVSINSATLVNKGLELIEAHVLFGVPLDQIEVVIHPQSCVHAMVEFTDGSTLVQVSPPDMRIPIALGMSWPDRIADAAPGCDWSKASTWQFVPVDRTTFPAIDLARQAAATGGTAPAVFNAANEECVSAFAHGQLAFTDIVDIVSRVAHDHCRLTDIAAMNEDDISRAETWARLRARQLISDT